MRVQLVGGPGDGAWYTADDAREHIYVFTKHDAVDPDAEFKPAYKYQIVNDYCAIYVGEVAARLKTEEEMEP